MKREAASLPRPHGKVAPAFEQGSVDFISIALAAALQAPQRPCCKSGAHSTAWKRVVITLSQLGLATYTLNHESTYSIALAIATAAQR